MLCALALAIISDLLGSYSAEYRDYGVQRLREI